MLERRIAYAKDKAQVISRLQAGEDSNGPFGLLADVLAFAAALGLKSRRRSPLVEPLAEPIRQSVFDRQGYDTMMNLLALQADARPEVLSDSEESINTRATIFEEYANGGLEILQDELRGARDVLESVVLLISSQRQPRDDGGGVFDLSKLVK